MSRSDIDDSDEEQTADPDDSWTAECICGMKTSSQHSTRVQIQSGMRIPTFCCDGCSTWAHIRCFHRYLAPHVLNLGRLMYCAKCEPLKQPWELCSVRTWRLIFKMLPLRDRRNASLVSRQWNRAVLFTAVSPRIVTNNARIALYMCQRIGTRDISLQVMDASIAEQLELHQVNDLELVDATDEMLALVPEYIRRLTICGARVTDAGVTAALRKAQGLRYLDLSTCDVSGAFAAALPPTLRTLVMVGCKISSAELAPLAELKQLTSLDVSHNLSLTDEMLRHVPFSIMTLNLSYTGVQVTALPDWKMIQVLYLSNTQIEQAVLQKLPETVQVIRV